VEAEEFAGGQPVIKAKVFGEEADFAPNRHLSRGPPEHLRATVAGSCQAQKHSDGGRLARPIGTEETKHLAAPDFKRKAPHGHFPAIDLAEPLRLNGNAVDGLQGIAPLFQ
jgi:hypothetical protein